MIRNPLVRDFLTGVVALAGFAALIVMLWRFGELSNVGKRYYEFTMLVDAAGGVNTASGVSMNGVRIGRVAAMRQPKDDLRKGVELVLRINEGALVPRDFTVFIDRSLVGEGTIELSLPPGLTDAQLADIVRPGEVIGPKKADTLFTRVADAVKEPLERLNTTAEKVASLADTLQVTGERINDLIEPRTLAEVEDGVKTPNLRTTLQKAESALSGLSQWLDDETILADAKAAVSRLPQLADEASNAIRNFDRSAATAGDTIDRLGRSVDEAIGQANETMRRVDAAAATVADIGAALERGEGSAGQFLTNPDLYNSLRDAATRLDKALVELQQLLEKYRKEGIPLRL